jgi:RNase H-fold protein (predicted Holliday junction resolvase)
MLLGIDPGTRKCGFAVIERLGVPPATLCIAPFEAFADRLAELIRSHPIERIAIGEGTNAHAIVELVRATGLPFHLVDERETSLQARARFFDDHPPRGWRRLMPRGMLLPDRPIDDYAALLIAERYLRLAQ